MRIIFVLLLTHLMKFTYLLTFVIKSSCGWSDLSDIVLFPFSLPRDGQLLVKRLQKHVVMRWLQLRFDFDSTAVRLLIKSH